MGRSRKFSLLGLFTLLPVSEAVAQQQPTLPVPVSVNPPSGQNILNFFSSRTPYEFWLTCIIGIFALIIIWLIVHSVRKIPNARPEDVTRPIVIVTIVLGTLILITAGYSNEQVAPAFGLFGTIVGYILGRIGPNQQLSAQSGAPTDTAQTPSEGGSA